MSAEQKFRKYPELVKGIRIQFKDLNEATRTGRIKARKGNFITVEGALKERRRIRITQVKGWWQPRVKCSLGNMIPLADGAGQPERKKRRQSNHARL